MIMALLAAYFFGGGLGGYSGSMLTTEAVKQLSKMAETIIADPARAEAARQTFVALRKEVKSFEKRFAKSGRQLTRFYKDHTAAPSQAIAVLEDLNSNWEASQQSAIDLRFELRDSLTGEEWATLFAGE